MMMYPIVLEGVDVALSAVGFRVTIQTPEVDNVDCRVANCESQRKLHIHVLDQSHLEVPAVLMFLASRNVKLAALVMLSPLGEDDDGQGCRFSHKLVRLTARW